MIDLTPQEEQLMLIVWQHGKGFVREFRELYPDPKPPYTTVATIMKKLEAKDYVVSKLYGNSFEYAPLVLEEEYKKRFLSGVVDNFFSNSYKEMVSFFAKEEKLSEDDLKEILEMIRSGNKSR